MVLPLYIYAVASAIIKGGDLPVYHLIVNLQYKFKTIGLDNGACQLTHVIAAAVITPKIFKINVSKPTVE